jgi:hypothetical protein
LEATLDKITGGATESHEKQWKKAGASEHNAVARTNNKGPGGDAKQSMIIGGGDPLGEPLKKIVCENKVNVGTGNESEEVEPAVVRDEVIQKAREETTQTRLLLCDLENQRYNQLREGSG